MHVTLFNNTLGNPDLKTYETAFRNAYAGQFPDSWSLLGYEAVFLIARAMEDAKSPLPQDTVIAMRNLKDFETITGKLSCGSDGEFSGYTVYMHSLDNGNITQIGEEI
jgi:ABC-type branched-subunit amino acid transport system substrate-binding protein